MRYAKIREMDISNGVGVGVSLFTQGCHFHCRGCFNPETWDFSGGKEWTQEVKDKFLKLIDRPYIERVSFLGGEPLCDENVVEIFNIILEIRSKFPDKKIWIYTGYNLDRIVENSSKSDLDLVRRYCAQFADIVVDGQFQLENQDLYNETIVWAGSTNQRVIDVKEYFKQINRGGCSD